VAQKFTSTTFPRNSENVQLLPERSFSVKSVCSRWWSSLPVAPWRHETDPRHCQREAPPHARTAPGRPVQHTEKLVVSWRSRPRPLLAVSNALAVHAKSQPKSSPLPQRVVTEIALRGQPRQSLRQAQFVLSRRQVPDLQRQIFCGSRSNVVGESAQPVNLVGDRLSSALQTTPSYAVLGRRMVRKPRLQPTLLWPGQRQSSSGQAKYGVS